MASFIVAAGFEYVHETYDVSIDVSMGIFKAVANTGLGGKVDYPVKPVLGKNLFDSGTITQISLNKSKALMIAENGKTILFEFYLIIAVKVIKAHDFIATLKKVNSKMEANKPRCARNQNLHRPLLNRLIYDYQTGTTKTG